MVHHDGLKQAFYDAFKALPTLKNYFASEAYKFDVCLWRWCQLLAVYRGFYCSCHEMSLNQKNNPVVKTNLDVVIRYPFVV